MNKLYHNIHQDIIDRCKYGDSGAQYQLYKLYYKAMFNTSIRIVNDMMEAEDIMQDSFLTAFEKLSSYSEKVSFGAWLKKIVINNSIDALKKKKLVSPIDPDTLHYGTSEDANVIIDEDSTYAKASVDEYDEELENINIKVEEIKQAINQLSDNYRIIISLYLLEGYDHEEIGEILNIASSTSRARLTRAKQKLLKKLSTNKINKL